MPQSLRCLFVGFWIFSVVFLAPSIAQSQADSSPQAKDCYTKIAPLLRSGDGQLTPEVRTAYLDWATQTVLDQLKRSNQTVSEDCLSEVQQDDTLRVAMVGSVFPLDPSILQNYAQLRTRLGPELLKKYRELVVAIAVARRTKGVENPGEVKSIGRDYQPDFWADESLQIPGSDQEREFTRVLADFMKRSRVSAAEVYQNSTVQRELKTDLTKQGVREDFVNGVKKSVWFGERLKYAMVLLEQRPAAREPKPDIVAWIRHLISLNEATPTSTPSLDGRPMAWPQFPTHLAPWPLLMPLAHAVPLSEANYIWEAFQGQHGPDRYHTYGPYRGDDDVIPDSLKPSKWFWDAWPDRIIHGGMCVPISKGTVDLYSALSKPAMWAGQPGHANLISFQYANNAWTAEIEQAFAGGPDVTFAQWYFDEQPGTMLRFRDLYYWPGAEYHLGLPLGMNIGLKSYMDTRIAAHIFRMLPDKEKQTVGVKLLRSALQINPYNPDIWYRLAEQIPDALQGVALVESAMKGNPRLLANGSDDTAFQQPREASGARDQYWRTLTPFVTQYAILSHPAPQRADNRHRVYSFLKSVPGINANDIANYAEKFTQTGSVELAADALTYDRNAAGDSYGQLRMGQRYRDGDGVAQNNARAREFFIRAASMGDGSAAILLNNMLPILPADFVTVTASSVYNPMQTVQHLIDGSGMVGAAHDNEGAAGTMWHTSEHPVAKPPASGLPPSPAWVRFDFSQPIKLSSLLIWNHNQEKLTDRGFRTTRLYGTTDGVTWSPLTAFDSVELPQASGDPFALPEEVSLSTPEVPLKAVIIAADAAAGNYGGNCYGLSAVRFLVRRLPEVIPSKAMTVTASSVYDSMQAAQHLIDGSGLIGAFHDNEGAAKTMWHTAERVTAKPPVSGLPASPAWVRFDFNKPTRFNSLLIWNHNQIKLTDRGFRKVRIYGSSDNVTWHPLTTAGTVELSRASGTPFSEPTNIKNTLADRAFKSVIIAAETADGNYGGNCYGLSAVRFVKGP